MRSAHPSNRSRRPRRRSLLRLLPAWLVLGGLGAVPVLPAQAEEEPPDLLPEVGVIELTLPDGSDMDGFTALPIGMDPGLGMLVAYAPFPARTLHLVDAETFEQRDVVQAMPTTRRSFAQPVVDAATHRVFYQRTTCLSNENFNPTVDPECTAQQIGMRSMRDLADERVITMPAPPGSVIPAMATRQVGDRNLLYVLVGRGDLELSLLAYDADALAEGSSTSPLWSFAVPDCPSVVFSTAIGISQANDFAYFACAPSGRSVHSTTATGSNFAVRVNFNSGDPGSQDPSRFTVEHHPFAGELNFASAVPDQAGEVLLITVTGSLKRVTAWDAQHRSYTGSVPLPLGGNTIPHGVDPATGRFYTLVVPVPNQPRQMLVSNARDVPVPQGAVRAAPYLGSGAAPPLVDPDRRHLIVPGPFLDDDGAPRPGNLAVYRDDTPPDPPRPGFDPDAATTGARDPDAPLSYTASASGYGMRLQQVGGPDNSEAGGFFGVPPLSDVVAALDSLQDQLGNDPRVAFPHQGSRGSDGGLVEGVGLQGTQDGAETATALAVGQVLDPATTDETVGVNEGLFPPAACSSLRADDPPEASTNGASVACALDEAAVEASASSQGDSPLEGANQGSSSTRVDEVDGVVTAHADAVVRNVVIPLPGGLVTIDEVRSVATAAAGGVAGSASSTLTATVRGARVVGPGGTVAFTCDTCAPADVAEAVNDAFPPFVVAHTGRSDLDPKVAGSPGGALAVVTEDRFSYWNDFNIHGDDRQEVPALQIVVAHDGDQPVREVFQLAAVFAGASYTIGLPGAAGALDLTLVDEAGDPLAGGDFEIRTGSGIDAALIDGGACHTAADGTGTCSFSPIDPGTYTITQTAAPDGYAPAPPFDVVVDPGFAVDVTVTNLRAVGAIDIELTDTSGALLPGGEFTVSLGAAGTEVGRCTTDASGFCGFVDVPLGEYAVAQTAAPPGLAPADPITFALTEPGQLATLSFVNAPPVGADGSGAAGGSVGSVTFGDGVSAPPEPVVAATPLPTALTPAPSRQIVPLLLGLPADVLRFATRSPAEAALVAVLLGLLALPGYLASRRRAVLTLAKDSFS